MKNTFHTEEELYQLSFERERHGSLYDRGSADSYYNRKQDPHWYPNGTPHDPRITNLDEAQLDEYRRGYEENEESGNHKEW